MTGAHVLMIVLFLWPDGFDDTGYIYARTCAQAEQVARELARNANATLEVQSCERRN